MGDGAFYRYVIDPLLSRPHRAAAAAIKNGVEILDIACGNGTLAKMYAKNAKNVLGIDIDDKSIAYAKSRVEATEIEKIHFQVMDASEMESFKNKQFTYSSISMAMHQFQRETALSILEQMQRISERIIIIDYHHPLSKRFSGMAVRLIEKMAGKEHHSNFITYMEHGGLQGLLDPLNLKPKHIHLDTKVFTVMEIV